VSKVQPIMVVYFEGQIHRIPVKQGPDGLDEFTGKIRWVGVRTQLGCCCFVCGRALKAKRGSQLQLAFCRPSMQWCARLLGPDCQSPVQPAPRTGVCIAAGTACAPCADPCCLLRNQLKHVCVVLTLC
jgi:hypothetical protein